jgi:hypothetical protein
MGLRGEVAGGFIDGPSRLLPALAAGRDAKQDPGLSQQVTMVTQSEFGRTLQPWGNHPLMPGGASDAELAAVFPNLAWLPIVDIGFMAS